MSIETIIPFGAAFAAIAAAIVAVARYRREATGPQAVADLSGTIVSQFKEINVELRETLALTKVARDNVIEERDRLLKEQIELRAHVDLLLEKISGLNVQLKSMRDEINNLAQTVESLELRIKSFNE